MGTVRHCKACISDGKSSTHHNGIADPTSCCHHHWSIIIHVSCASKVMLLTKEHEKCVLGCLPYRTEYESVFLKCIINAFQLHSVGLWDQLGGTQTKFASLHRYRSCWNLILSNTSMAGKEMSTFSNISIDLTGFHSM